MTSTHPSAKKKTIPSYKKGLIVKLTPISDYNWTDNFSFMRTLTCINHQSAKYLTKNPFSRGIHVVKLPIGDIQRTNSGECTCPFTNLAVVEETMPISINYSARLQWLMDFRAQAIEIVSIRYGYRPYSLINVSDDTAWDQIENNYLDC